MPSWQRNICDEFGCIFFKIFGTKKLFSVQSPPNLVQCLVQSSAQRNVQILTCSLVEVVSVFSVHWQTLIVTINGTGPLMAQPLHPLGRLADSLSEFSLLRALPPPLCLLCGLGLSQNLHQFQEENVSKIM